MLKHETDCEQWPEGFFENVLGAWGGELRRPSQGVYEERKDLSDNNNHS